MSNRDEIEAAAARLHHHVRRTPILPLDHTELAADVTLKLEYLQHSGSFKARGAFNRLLTLDVPAAGVAAASGGNHGAAVAFAAHKLGMTATVFVPGPTPTAKLDRIRAYGATVVQEGSSYADALAACQAHQPGPAPSACTPMTTRRCWPDRARSRASSRPTCRA